MSAAQGEGRREKQNQVRSINSDLKEREREENIESIEWREISRNLKIREKKRELKESGSSVTCQAALDALNVMAIAFVDSGGGLTGKQVRSQ